MALGPVGLNKGAQFTLFQRHPALRQTDRSARGSNCPQPLGFFARWGNPSMVLGLSGLRTSPCFAMTLIIKLGPVAALPSSLSFFIHRVDIVIPTSWTDPVHSKRHTGEASREAEDELQSFPDRSAAGSC